MLSILNIVAKKLKVHLLIFISSIIISILLFQNFTWGKNTTSVITLAQLLMCWMIGYCATWPSIVHGFKEKADHFSPFSFKGYFCISSCCCWKKINVAIPIEKKKWERGLVSTTVRQKFCFSQYRNAQSVWCTVNNWHPESVCFSRPFFTCCWWGLHLFFCLCKFPSPSQQPQVIWGVTDWTRGTDTLLCPAFAGCCVCAAVQAPSILKAPCILKCSQDAAPPVVVSPLCVCWGSLLQQLTGGHGCLLGPPHSIALADFSFPNQEADY